VVTAVVVYAMQSITISENIVPPPATLVKSGISRNGCLDASNCRAIQRAGARETEAAIRMGIDQQRVSKLIRGHFDEYSVARLLEFLAALGNDIEIRVSRRANAKHGNIRVRAA